LVERKGIAYAIKAVAELKRRGRKIRYSVVGDGEIRANLEALIKDLDLTGEVHLLGWKNHDEVHSLLNDSHLLVCPSVTVNGDQEGVPNAVKKQWPWGCL
jgi:colanic acid/amylovoran biosynthesis glycosyltransferase